MAGGRDRGGACPVPTSGAQLPAAHTGLQRDSWAAPAPLLQNGALGIILLPWNAPTLEKQPSPLAPHPACPRTPRRVRAWFLLEMHGRTPPLMLFGATCAPSYMQAGGAQPPTAPVGSRALLGELGRHPVLLV